MNPSILRSVSVAWFGCLFCAATAFGVDWRAYDTASAGPTYLVQGEYVDSTTTPGHKVAAQVWTRMPSPSGFSTATQGAGVYQATILGGLPGAGWDGNKTRVYCSGITGANKVDFTGNWFTGTIDFAGTTFNLSKSGFGTYVLKKVVRHSPTEGSGPTPGGTATVLFDGTSASASKWINEGTSTSPTLNTYGYLPAGVQARASFPYTKFRLHVEYRDPYMPQLFDGNTVYRGNSSVFVNWLNIQILDNFGGIYSPGNNLLDNGAIYDCKSADTGAVFSIDGRCQTQNNRGTFTNQFSISRIVVGENRSLTILDSLRE